jgi:hypothetical protein
MISFRFSVEQISIRSPFRLLERSPAKDFDERGKFYH